MKCSKIIEHLEYLAPQKYACDWDNPGLLAGRHDKEVKKIMIVLDVTDQVLAEAIDHQIDLIISHHPLIFKAIKQVNDQNFISNRILKLIQNDISYYAMHTNFDVAPGGMADLAAAKIKLSELSVLDILSEQDGVCYGIGRVGKLDPEVTLKTLAGQVKEAFSLPFVTVYGMADGNKVLERAAISPGAGNSMVAAALKTSAQVLITGDIGHHTGIDAVAQGLLVIDAGHYGLEHIFMDYMESYIKNEIDHKLIIYKEEIVFPATIII